MDTLGPGQPATPGRSKTLRRLAVVTGASTGIGLETVRGLAGLGLHVVLTARSDDKVAQGLSALRPDGAVRVSGEVLNPAQQDSVDDFFVRMAKNGSHVDVLVNNAASIYDRRGHDLESTPATLAIEAINNNAISALHMIQASLPAMRRAGYGRIVNVSSTLAGLTEMKGGTTAYRLSKVVMNALTRIAAAEADGDILVNSVCPGWTRTSMGGEMARLSPEEAAQGVVWAATLPADGPNGGFFRNGQPLAW